MALDNKLGEVYVDLEARTAKFNQKVKQAELQTERSAGRMQKAFSTVTKSILGPLGLTVGIGFAVTKLKSMVTETIKARDEIAKFSKATGVSVDFLSSIGFAAERSGSSLQSLQVGMRGLLRNMQGVRDGLAESRRSFEQLNVQVLDNNGNLRNSEDVFLDVSEAIRGMSNDTERAALAQEIFGRQGIALVPLLKEGKDGIMALQQEAKRLSITFGEEAAKEAEAAADAITNFDTAMSGLTQGLIQLGLPTLTDLANKFSDITVEIQKMTKVGDEAPDWIKGLFVIHDVVDFVAQAIEAMTQDIIDYQKSEESLTVAQGEAIKILKEYAKEYEEIDKLRTKGLTVPEGFDEFVPGFQQIQESTQGILDGVIPLVPKIEYISQTSKGWKGEVVSVKENFDHMNESADDFNRAQQAAVNLATALSNQFFQAAINGQNLLGTVRAIVQSLAVRAATAGLVSSIFPGVGFAKAFLGFQHGGQFTVRGSGGPDSQLVAFRASPGERVTITPENHTTTNNSNVTIVAPELRWLDDDFTLNTRVAPKLRRALGI